MIQDHERQKKQEINLNENSLKPPISTEVFQKQGSNPIRAYSCNVMALGERVAIA